MNIDRFRHSGEPGLTDLDSVNSKGQALNIQLAEFGGGQSISILISVAGNLNYGFQAMAGRVGNLETQLGAIALAKKRQPAKRK